ncbi:ribosome-inactivating family protein [Streptomyces sp. NPDC050121]|uniref:ribosome-inactivating family protein n=1 Tax=Streptomyces sp. NPDC050121 TaxID=3365601 RepID=UPI003793E1E6
MRRLWSAVLTLAMAAGLVTVMSGSASAWEIKRVIDWNISGIHSGGAGNERSYYNVIDSIHRESYGNSTPMDSVRQTQLNREQLIQVRVNGEGNAQLASIYLWADNLYVAGFWSPGRNGHPGRHWAFDDRRNDFAQALHVPLASLHTMPSNGSYTQLPGGQPEERAQLAITSARIWDAMYTLNDVPAYSDPVGRSMLIAIQIFSEASRFAAVFDTVRENIREGRETPLNHFDAQRGNLNLAALENQWGQISQFAHDNRQNPQIGIWVMGHLVTSLAGLAYWCGGFVELNGSQARL